MPCPEKFMESLEKFRVPAEIAAQIGDGFAGITSKSPKKERAAFFARAVEILEKHIDMQTLRELMEENACCRSGAREKASKAFARENADESLDRKLARIPSVANMGTPQRNPDGTITVHAVRWQVDGQFRCACPNFSGLKRAAPVSKNYCLCCAEHFRHHYEIMLGVKLQTLEIVSSPLNSGGMDPCVIRFAVL